MEKPAVTDYPIHDLIRRRWSPVAFDARPIAPTVMNQLFEAARWAASSSNEQPWSYVVASKAEVPEGFERLASVLLPGNAWAKKAPVLALSVAKKSFFRDHSPNRVAFHDVGMATANLIFQAISEGIFVHQMAGYDVEKAREVLGIPEGYEPVAMIALGYPGDPEKLEEKQKQREFGERNRKKIGTFVFRGKWGGETL